MKLRMQNTSTKHTVYCHILPLSQDVLNSVRMGTSELRIRMGSEPRKFIEVAEYKLFSGKKKKWQQANGEKHSAKL